MTTDEKAMFVSVLDDMESDIIRQRLAIKNLTFHIKTQLSKIESARLATKQTFSKGVASAKDHQKL